MQATATGADEAVWRDDLLDAGQMRWQRAAIAGPDLWRAPGRAVVRLIRGMDGGDGRLQILQRQIELLGAELLGTAAEDGLAEGSDQLFQALDPLVLAQGQGLCGKQQRLQRRVFFQQSSGIPHVS